jgi:antitoxin VapB
MAVRTSLFLSDHGQVVRLPKSVSFPPGTREVVILREGNRRIIVPADGVWDDFFDGPGVELPERSLTSAQERETF